MRNWLFILVVASFISCDKEEPIPGYLYIDTFNLNVKGDRSQGSNDHDILDGWVYVGGKLIGVFELPAKIPVITSGTQAVTVIAGIKKNGINNSRITYPFYESYITEVTFEPSMIDTIHPTTRYREACDFQWIEDFEDQTIGLSKSGSNSTVDSMHLEDNITKVYNYDGVDERFSGAVRMDTGYQIFEFSSVKLFDLPRSGTEIYLELNYLSDLELIVGIYPISGSVVQGTPIVNLFANTEWKKAYISLKEDVNSANNIGVDFRIFFAARKEVGTDKAEILLDNIKLITFE